MYNRHSTEKTFSWNGTYLEELEYSQICDWCALYVAGLKDLAPVPVDDERWLVQCWEWICLAKQ